MEAQTKGKDKTEYLGTLFSDAHLVSYLDFREMHADDLNALCLPVTCICWFAFVAQMTHFATQMPTILKHTDGTLKRGP